MFLTVILLKNILCVVSSRFNMFTMTKKRLVHAIDDSKDNLSKYHWILLDFET